MLENIVRKGEIACFKQFFLFSKCFSQLISLVRRNAALCGWKRLKELIFHDLERLFVMQKIKSYKFWSTSASANADMGQYFFEIHFAPFHCRQLIFFNPFPNKPWFLRVCSKGL